MFVGTVGLRRLGVSFSGITLSALALSACGGGDPKPVDAKDWVSDFCDAAKDYQSSSDDLGDDFIDIEFDKKGAKDSVVKVFGKLQKEQDKFQKAADKAGTPDLDSGKEIKKAVGREFKERSDSLKKVVDEIKKLDEGRRFEQKVGEALTAREEGDFRGKLDKLASKRTTKDAQDVIDLIDADSDCSAVLFAP